MKRRVLSLLMAALMVFTLVPMNALAAGSNGLFGDVTVTITKQPENVNVYVGETATFTIEAEADSSLSTVRYAWVKASDADDDSGLTFDKIRSLISSGSTEKTLTISNCTMSDNGSEYKCIVYTSLGNISTSGFSYKVSNTVTLTVVPLPECESHKIDSETFVHYEAKAPTCADEGNKDYYYCTVCKRYYALEDGTLTETTEDAVTLDKTETHTLEYHAAVASTCAKQGNIEYWQCSVCDKCFTDAAGTQSISRLKLDVDKDPENHSNLVYKERKNPTCTTDGYIAHYYCDGCDQTFSDAEGKTEIDNVKLDKLGHDWSKTIADETYHYTQCSRCGSVTDTEAHSGGTATCSAKAVCSVCGAQYGELDSSNHANWKYINRKEATETEKGYSGDKQCSDCGVIFETGHEVDYICIHETVYHAAAEATCKAAGNSEYWECSKCGKLYSDENCTTEVTLDDVTEEQLEHYIISVGSANVPNPETLSDEYASNSATHWRQCKFCGYQYTDTTSTHSIISGEATCVHGDSYCAICGYSTGKTDPDNHTGDTEVRDAKEPIGAEPGYTGDTYCLDCGKKIASGTEYYAACEGGCAATLTLIEGTPATCTEDGVKDYYVCSVCHNRYLDANATQRVESEADLVDEAGHDFHPGIDTFSLTDLAELAKAIGLQWTDIVKMFTEQGETPSLESFIKLIHVKNIDHCYNDEDHWLGCQRCGKTLEDLRDELTAKGYTINEAWYELSRKEAHSGSEATCKSKAQCTECGEYYGELGDHRYNVVVTEPTCTEKGYTTHTCTVCSDSYTDSETPMTGHYIYRGVCQTCGAKVFANPFYDVPSSKWYYSPIMWAYYYTPQITNGVGGEGNEQRFDPDGYCTRAQVVTFLWRAAGKPEPSGSNSFNDVDRSAFYYKAVLWAAEQGITNGVGGGKFAPDLVVSRAEFVTFLWRYVGKPSPTNMVSPFTDVNRSSFSFAYSAILWAAEQGITNGVGNGQFAPAAGCTRAQVVAFLCRAFNPAAAAAAAS